MKTIKCQACWGPYNNILECTAPSVWMVWGCCEYYRYAMCDEHAQLAVSEDWGAATTSCEPTEIQPIDEYMEMSNGYGFESYR